MSDEYDWTPWVDHDGKGCPLGLIEHMHAKGFTRMTRTFDGSGRTHTPGEQATPTGWSPDHPGWTWKRSGWFGRGYWIASDPACSRVIKYRFGRPKPKALEKSASVDLLKAIAKGAKQPDQEPYKADTP